MCFKDSNVEYLDKPARESSFNPNYSHSYGASGAATMAVPPDDDAKKEAKEAKAAAKAKKKAEKKAQLEVAAAIRRKNMYGPGGGYMYASQTAGGF